jgi:hypothetical protein
MRALGIRMPLTILKYSLFLVADLVIFGCVIHFFYMGLRKPVEFVELGRIANLSLEHFRIYRGHKTIWPAVRFRLGAVAYFLAVFLGLGFCIYGGVFKLLSWMPHSWIYADDYYFGLLTVAFLGAGSFIGLTIKSAHDVEAAIRELAIKSGNVEYFRRYLLDENFPNEEYQPHGWTRLHQLAALGKETLPAHARMAEDLLRSGADVNCRTILGCTPLHFIAMQGQAQTVELAKVLIAHGLDLTAVDNLKRGWKDYCQHGKEIYDLLEDASKR